MSITNQRISLTVVLLVALASLIAGLFVAQHWPQKKIAMNVVGSSADHQAVFINGN